MLKVTVISPEHTDYPLIFYNILTVEVFPTGQPGSDSYVKMSYLGLDHKLEQSRVYAQPAEIKIEIMQDASN